MSQVVRAIYENGIFRPLESLNLVEREQVRLTVEPDSSSGKPDSSVENGLAPENNSEDPLKGLRKSTGIPDLAENFDDYRFGKRIPSRRLSTRRGL